jgi:hypothetical protein
MAGILSQSLDAYAGGYDPAKRRATPDEQLAVGCCNYCGVPHWKTKYRFNGQEFCLSCVLEEAGIVAVGVDFR